MRLVFGPCERRVVVGVWRTNTSRGMLQISIFMSVTQRPHELGAGRRRGGVFKYHPAGSRSCIPSRRPRTSDDHRRCARRRGRMSLPSDRGLTRSRIISYMTVGNKGAEQRLRLHQVRSRSTCSAEGQRTARGAGRPTVGSQTHRASAQTHRARGMTHSDICHSADRPGSSCGRGDRCGRLFAVWYFSAIVVYILVAAVLAVVGRPLVERLVRCTCAGRHMPARWRRCSRSSPIGLVARRCAPVSCAWCSTRSISYRDARFPAVMERIAEPVARPRVSSTVSFAA